MKKTLFTKNNLVLLTTFLCCLFAGSPVYAIDEENCLMCHRHRGLSHIDENGNFRLLYISEPIYQNSPHGLFACTDCHTDIKEMPHTNAKKVDCLMQCHLDDSYRWREFSHAEVGEIMAESVHSPVDADGNLKPHQEDYPTCKTCHQDPLYRPLAFFKNVRPGVSDKIINRCLVCHDDPVYVKKFYNHFSSRMQKGRSPREVVEMCATCHEDRNFQQRHNLSDVVYSYWETYHGKAVFFGDEMSPDCLDCHAGFTGSVHSMHASDDPRSSVHPDNVHLSCSNIDCHPTSDPNLADYDVHMLVDREEHAVEYYISAFFVTLTLLSFIPIMLALILDLIRSLVPVKTIQEHRPTPPRPLVDGVELGNPDPIVQEKRGKKYFYHLTLNQRFQHIVLMVAFAGLALTGLPMKYFHVSFMEKLYYLIGGIELAPLLHRIFAVAMIIIFAYHFIYILSTYITYYYIPLIKARKCTFTNFIKSMLALPMVPTLEDLRDAWKMNKYRLFITNVRPASGRFTLKEKFGYFAVFWGVPVIGISGLMLWGEELYSKYFVIKHFLNACYIAHSDEALLACIVIFLWHIYNTHLKYENFPMGMAWLTGYKHEKEIEEGHAGYYQGLVGEKQHASDRGGTPSGVGALIFRKCFQSTLLLVLIASTGFLSWVVFNTVFGYHVIAYKKAPEQYPLTKPNFLEEVVTGGTCDKKFYRGFRIVDEAALTDHYHNITFKVGPDNRSHCIMCHGDFPHGKTEQIRTYLNMHAFFLGCETCHVRPESKDKPFEYRWYNRDSGTVLKNTPKIEHVGIDTLGIKLIPGDGTGGNWKRIDSDEEIAYARKFYNQLNSGEFISDEEKKESCETIHRRVSKETITCKQCHQEETSLIPYNKIGYSQHRVDYLLSDEIINVIHNYDLFMIPQVFQKKKNASSK